jgi:hypothetical protein
MAKKSSYLLFFLLAFVLISSKGVSQENKSIQGVVSSAEGHLQYANVLLFHGLDSIKPLHAIITDSSGRFAFTNLQSGTYTIKVLLIGYTSNQRVITLSADQKNIDLGMINLKILSKELESINISGQKKLIEKTAQGFVVNASANLTQVGGTLTDLLRNTPTIVVDGDGAVTLRGKTPMILINGRNSSFTNTDQIASSSIESIEIINNPSAQYDAAAESGIINVKLKKNKQNGFNGAMVVGTGYGARGRFNSSVLLNNKTSKWNIGAGYDNRFAGRTRGLTGDRTNFNLLDVYSIKQTRADKRTEALQNMKFTVDYSPNSNNQISFEALKNFTGENNNEFLTSTISNQQKLFGSKTTRQSIEITNEKLSEYAMNYNRKFSDKRKSFTSSISTSIGNEKQNTDITSQAYDVLDLKKGNEFLQKTNNYQNTTLTNLKADYVQPISERSELLTGYKGTLRNMDADFQVRDKINGALIQNILASNNFKFNEQIHAGYIQLNSYSGTKDNPTFKYDMGLRGEGVSNDGVVKTTNQTFKNNYFKLFPSAGIAYFKNADEFWKINYSRRINRPGLGQLNPFIDITDSLNPHGGNPDLKPELVNSLELGYSKDLKAFNFYSVVFYRHANNAIRSFTIFKPNGVALIIPVNFGNVSTYGLEQVTTVKASRVYDFNLSFSLFQQKYEGSNVAKDVVNNVFSWYGKWINNFTTWKGGKLQVTAVYNSPLATPQGKRVAIYYTDLGFQQKLGKENGRLGLVISDVFNTQRNGFVQNTKDFTFTRKSKIDSRAILLTFALTIGGKFKEKLMENKFIND